MVIFIREPFIRLNEENYNNEDVLGIVDHASMMVTTTTTEQKTHPNSSSFD